MPPPGTRWSWSRSRTIRFIAIAPLLDETSSLNDAPLPLVEASTDTVYTAFNTADVAGPVLDELEPSLDMSDSLVPVQKAEELELRSSGATEFQVCRRCGRSRRLGDVRVEPESAADTSGLRLDPHVR